MAENTDLKVEENEDDVKTSASEEGKEEGEEEGKEPETEPKKKPLLGEGEEPPVRKRPIDFILERKEKKIAKLESRIEKLEEEEGEVAPEDEETIIRVVQKRFAPFFEKSIQEEDERELSTFLGERPEFKPYEAKIRKFMSHPSRKQLPIKAIAYEVAGDELLKIGAKERSKADEEAKRSQIGGSSARGDGEQGIWEMSKEEFEAKKEEIRRGRA